MKPNPLVPFLTLSMLLTCLALQAQSPIKYLSSNNYSLDSVNHLLPIEPSDITFFGAIHGSNAAQEVDYQLLQTLSNASPLVYAPEIDHSLAFFFQAYLNNPNDTLLFALCSFYSRRVPQDASKAFMNKWRKLAELNNKLIHPIQVAGFDQPLSKELAFSHLCHLVENTIPELPTLKPDSHYSFPHPLKNPIKRSRKLWKYMLSNGYHWEDFSDDPRTEMFNQANNYFLAQPAELVTVFGTNANEVQRIFEGFQKNFSREEFLFHNFQQFGLSWKKKGYKIYSNLGYFHIQQAPINGSKSVACLLKEEGTFTIHTIAGVYSQSECMKSINFRSAGSKKIHGFLAETTQYIGYTTSKLWDGDSIFEKLKGMSYLKSSSLGNNTLFILNKSDSPFYQGQLFVKFSRGGGKWKTSNELSTLDYIQSIVLMKHSNACVPYQHP